MARVCALAIAMYGLRLATGRWKFYGRVCLFNVTAKMNDIFKLMRLT